MGAAAHLGIEISAYDRRIRTFIPGYEDMLDAAAAAVPRRARQILDLGIGTGALAARALARLPRATAVGIDADNDMLRLAARRLLSRVALVHRSFLRAPLPLADAIIASLALHHIRTRGAKARLYRRVREAIRPDGVFVSADCHPAGDSALAAAQLHAWHEHVDRSHTRSQRAALFRSWAREDVYVPLDAEIALFQRAGFRVDVVWRRGAFAVLVGSP